MTRTHMQPEIFVYIYPHGYVQADRKGRVKRKHLFLVFQHCFKDAQPP